MPFPRSSAWSEMHIASSSIWNRVSDSIFYVDNCHASRTSIVIYVHECVWTCVYVCLERVRKIKEEKTKPVERREKQYILLHICLYMRVQHHLRVWVPERLCLCACARMRVRVCVCECMCDKYSFSNMSRRSSTNVSHIPPRFRKKRDPKCKNIPSNTPTYACIHERTLTRTFPTDQNRLEQKRGRVAPYPPLSLNTHLKVVRVFLVVFRFFFFCCGFFVWFGLVLGSFYLFIYLFIHSIVVC